MDMLVKKAQRGNDKAFLKLFQTYEEELYRIALFKKPATGIL